MSSPDLDEALRRSEEFAARLIESSRDCIKVLDLKGHLLSMNAHGMTALEICDFGPLIGSPWVDFWEGQDKDQAKAAIELARQGKVGQFTGFFPTRQSNTPKWWAVSVTAILDRDGHPEKLLAVSRDITELKRAEQVLRESQALLERQVAERNSDLAKTSAALREIVEGVEAKVGEQFFPALVQQLARVLGVDYAFVSEFCVDRSKVRTLAFWAVDHFLDNFEYAIA
ncbi:MAG TPA: PAS domain-containing protein, partial [Nitrospira sp.]